MNLPPLASFEYNGARSLVLLHETHLLSCVEVWREAKHKKIQLPKTEDKDYESLETLLQHILAAARGYMIWICEKLELPDPEIQQIPSSQELSEQLDSYVEHLLVRWRLPLVNIHEKKFHFPAYPSRWKVEYCIDAMLEHAVMHPIRHEYQLKNLIQEQQK